MFTRKRQSAPAPVPSVEGVAGIGHEVVCFLSQQGLAHSPANYALAWRVKAERRSMVAVAVDAVLMEGKALTQADVDRIMVAEARHSDGADGTDDPHHAALRHQTLRLADLTAGAATQSSAFGRELSSGLFHLSGGAGSIEQIVTAMVERTRGVEKRLTAASREIEDLRQQVETTRDDAQRDALTGLLNRRGVLHELAARGEGGHGVVALCDVDHFKSINDRYGHGVGDRVLKGVAACLADSIGAHVVARWGGEEFLIVLDRLDMEPALRLLETARANLAARTFRLRTTDEPIGAVTISIGAASLADDTIDGAIEAADRMLYAAKREGRNRIVIDPRSAT